MTDPIRLASEARAILEKLHKRDDVVVRFKTDTSGYAEDALDDLDREAPGHFRAEKLALTLNLDTLVSGKKPLPSSLAAIEDWRKYPVLAGLAAHESAHARFSLWDSEENPLPDRLPNPKFDPADLDGESGPEFFRVSETGKLYDLARLLEEPRVERLGTTHFTKTWRRAMQMSAAHLILQGMDEDDAQGEEDPLDAAVKMAVLIGGRLSAGTLGNSYESRKHVRKILDSAQKIIETALPDAEDPFHSVMGIINKAVFSNEHESGEFMLECARQILEIVHEDESDDPDGDGKGEGDEEGEEGEGSGGEGSGSGEGDEAMREMAKAMQDAVDGAIDEMQEQIKVEEEHDTSKPPEDGGYGSVLYQNPQAPQIDRYEQPNTEDRSLYRRALAWMEAQIQPTVTESEVSQWLPTGGARLDVRGFIRDNMAERRASQRADWSRVSETVKPAPPVKVAIMLDGSGSMHSLARPSASIAWAASNAAADLPESRTISVVYGDAAAVTQPPGHQPARAVAVSRTDGGTEDFASAAQMVEDGLWLDEAIEEGEPSNVLIIIISDLMYGGTAASGESQQNAFQRIAKDWRDRGLRVVVVGASCQPGSRVHRHVGNLDELGVELVTPKELFR